MAERLVNVGRLVSQYRSSRHVTNDIQNVSYVP